MSAIDTRFNKQILRAGSTALLIALLSWPAARAWSASAQPPASAQMKPAMNPAMKPAMNPAGTGFLVSSLQDGLAEIQVSQLVLKKSTNAEVKAFAQHMITDHGKANQEIRSLATSKKTALPQAVKPEQKAAYQKLSALSGKAFDQAVMSHFVEDHEKAVKAFSDNAKANPDPQIRAFAAKTLKVLQMHLQMARDVNRKVNG